MSKKTDKKMDVWKKKLLDMGMRNRLLNYKDTQRGTMNITAPDLKKLYKLLVLDEKELTFPRIEIRVQDVEDLVEGDGEETKEVSKAVEVPGDISTDRTARETTQIAKNLKDKARIAKEEQGVNVLYTAFGFLEWKEAEHSSVVVRSPLVLVPVVITSESINDPYVLSLHEDEIVVNPTLVYKMQNEMGIELPEFDSQNDDISEYIAKVNKKVSKQGWKATEDVSISLLSFLKINMYKDLENRAATIAANPIVKALAGDGRSNELFDDGNTEYEHDKMHVEDVFQVVDADSSQQDAIEKSKKGVSFVLQGPPGTGKSQTITNIIAEALAAGKKVLFVSEKMAALEVVYRRLENVGLADFCLVLHSNKANKREFMDSLRKVINLKPISVRDSAMFKLTTLEEKRDRLNEYSQELHVKVMPLDQTIFEANGLLAQYSNAPNIDFKLKKTDIGKVTREDLYNFRLRVSELSKTEQKLTEEYSRNTWMNTVVEELNHEKRHDISSTLDRAIEAIEKYLSETLRFKDELSFDMDVSMSEYPKVSDFMRFCSTGKGFPVEWLSCNDLSEHTEIACKFRDRKNKEAGLRVGIEEKIGEEFLSYDGTDKFDLIDKLLNEIKALLWKGYSDKKLIINDLEQILDKTNSAVNCMKAKMELLQLMTDILAIDQPKRDDEIAEIISLAEKYSMDLRPDEYWFTKDWSARKERADLIEQLKSLIKRIGDAREAVRENYDNGIVDIDYRGMITRMRTDYTSFFRVFNSNFKTDMNAIRSYRKIPAKKIAYEEMLDILEKIKEYHDALSEMEEGKERFAKVLGGWFAGEQTDFRGAETAIEEFDQIKAIYRGQIPTMVKKDMLSGSNIDRLLPDVAKLSKLVEAPEMEAYRDIVGDTDVPIWKNNENANILISKLTEVKTELDGLSEKYGSKVSRYDYYTGLKQLQELRALSDLDDKEAPALPEMFYEMYQGDNTVWDEIINRLKWVIDYKEQMDADEKFNHGIAAGGDFIEKIKDIVLILDSFDKDGMDKIRSFDGLFNEKEALEKKKISKQLEKAKQCRANLEGLEDWIDFKNAVNKCNDLGLDDFVNKVLKSDAKPEEYDSAFMKKFERLWLDYATKSKPAVDSFRGKTQDDVIDEFRILDKEQLMIAQSRIREKLISCMPNVSSFTSSQDEVGILMHELGKHRKIMPVRKLFDRIPNLLPKLKPCMMMSPLSVSQFIQSDNYLFDMVIFDEASQVKTENAIGAISRGKQVIIAGDIHQLPPTNFFAASLSGSDEYEDDEDDSEAFESILDEANTIMTQLTLKWHYRSKNENLIAFSNANIYNNSLTTFPSPTEKGSNEGVEYIYVPDGIYQRSGKRNNPIEAKKVVDVIFDELKRYPNRSMGVITFSEAQQRCVEAEVIARRLANPSFEEYFAEDRKEPFFIKNLENVQGDERDTIIFSIGYGKSDPMEELKMNFGPINKGGGYRRLNVAVTRAKYSVKLVGSILPTDMRITDDTPKGVRLLRDYIEFAQQGVKALENKFTYSDAIRTESPFEDSVYAYLINNGYNVRTQVGCSGYRIDMAVRHPSLEGRFVIGIECDGASYHSSRTARERDRLRQSVLESMGWKLYRIWSTDWIKDPVSEGKHLSEAIDEAIKTYDETPNTRKKKSGATKEPKSSKYEKEIKVPETKEDSGFVFGEYREISFRKATTEKQANVIAEGIEKIVNAQAPVHIMLVSRQVAPLFGYVKATTRVQEEVARLVRSYGRGKYSLKGEFIWLKDQKKVLPKVPYKDEKPRPIEMIAVEEIAEALVEIIDKSYGIEKNALYKVFAREYGFRNMTDKLTERVEEAYKKLEKAKRIRDVEGKLSVAE